MHPLVVVLLVSENLKPPTLPPVTLTRIQTFHRERSDISCTPLVATRTTHHSFHQAIPLIRLRLSFSERVLYFVYLFPPLGIVVYVSVLSSPRAPKLT